MRRFTLMMMCVIFSYFTHPEMGVSQDFRGQLSGWLTYQDVSSEKPFQNGGIRYLPELTWAFSENPSNMVDIHLAANLFAFHQAGEFQSEENRYPDYTRRLDGDPYRWWIRYSTTHLEIRAGLQKLNFGPAKLLRSLMWFDRLDPRDPLQLTEGVHALLGRYIFTNNANIWAWGLYSDQETKGWETIPSQKGTGEFGGRIQLPHRLGDVGLTLHTRKAQILAAANPLFSRNETFRENRVALDGFFDVGIGLWFESALVSREMDMTLSLLPETDTYVTLGADYTLPLGSGLHVMAEHLHRASGEQPFDDLYRYDTSGFSASYPVTWLDNIAYYGFYNWNMDLAYHYMSWRRTLNNWVVNLALYGSNQAGSSDALSSNLGEFGGDFGIQFMIIFNH